jgi:hypothetical protein
MHGRSFPKLFLQAARGGIARLRPPLWAQAAELVRPIALALFFYRISYGAARRPGLARKKDVK